MTEFANRSPPKIARQLLRLLVPTHLLAVATLALGIGATTASFRAVNPILFESLPYPNADQLTMLWEGSSDVRRSCFWIDSRSVCDT